MPRGISSLAQPLLAASIACCLLLLAVSQASAQASAPARHRRGLYHQLYANRADGSRESLVQRDSSSQVRFTDTPTPTEAAQAPESHSPQIEQAQYLESPMVIDPHSPFVGDVTGHENIVWPSDMMLGCESCAPSPCHCGACGPCQIVPSPPVCPTFGITFFAEYMYLHARDADVAFALPQNGLVVGAAPNGPVGVVDPQYESGFRLGATWRICADAGLTARWSSYESNTTAFANSNVIRPLLLFPPTFNAGTPTQPSQATYGIDFQFIDVDYRAIAKSCNNFWLGYILGARYANLEQRLSASYIVAQADGSRTLSTSVDFDGFGIRVGLEGERQIFPCSWFSIYGRGIANFLSGEFRSTFVQTNPTTGLVEVSTSYAEDKIVPLMELELGVAVELPYGWRFSIGYLVNGWFNTTTTPSWINGVQQLNFNSLDDALTFDGFTGRIEWTF